MTASISGQVEDATGAGINAATVTIKSLETGASRVVTTDDTGNFRAQSLPLGPQEVKAEKPGFKPVVRSGVRLEVGQEAVVNLRLQVGEFAQQVTVVAESPVVNTTTASVSGVVNEEEVKDLPLNGRSFDNLITLNPGATNYSAYKSANTSTSNGNTFSVAGRRTIENEFLLNGVEYTGSSQLAVSPGGASQELLGIDAVREFNLLTDTYGAEYGKRAGAQVVIVTQSGSNAVHGTVFEFLRNSDLDARNFFDQQTHSAPPFRRNQFGGALGGPLKKDKLFLFANYEGFRQALAVSSVSEVPDANARLGLLPNASGVPTTVSGLNQSMLQYMQMWPAPNGTNLGSGVALSFNNPHQSIREDFGTTRSDYILSDKDSLSASWTIDDGRNLSPLADPLFGSILLQRNQVATLRETRIVSPGAVNAVTVGFSRAAFTFNPYEYSSFPSSLDFVTGFGFPGGITIGGGATTTGISSITAAGPNNAAFVWNRRNLFTWADDFRINKGMHEISLGIWFQRLQDNENTASRQLGAATFASLTTFLQSTVTTFQVVQDPNELGWRSLYGAWYAEDNIKLRPHLTVRVGLRHEFDTGWNEVSGRASNYITSGGLLVTNPIVGNSIYTTNNAKLLFSPRVALAWDPFGDGKTAIRAGFGTYYSMIDALSFLMNSVPPYNGSVSFAAKSLPTLLPVVSGVQPAQPCGPGIPQPCTIYAPQGVQPNAKTPTVEEWNFTVERQIDNNTSLRLAYVGSHGYHGFLSVDPNSIPAQVCQTATCTSGGVNTGTTTGTVLMGQQYILANPGNTPATTRPNQYLSGGFFWYTEGNTSYNALQVDVMHRLSHGFQIRGNYTWSKDLDINSGLTGAQSSNQAQMILDRNNLPRDWGLSALNIANQASISASWDLPFARGLTGLSKNLLGGWQLNGIATMLSGFPFTPQVGSNRSGDGDTRNPDRPNVNTSFSGPVILGNPNEWFNPQAFLLPTLGTYGNLGRATLTGPGLADLDMSLFKNFSVTERSRLQIRAELFNLFNHPNFAAPNAVVFSGTNPSPTAGYISATATTSRQFQIGAKLIF